MFRTIQAFGVVPGQLHGVLSIVPEEPNAVPVSLLAPQMICNLKQRRARRSAIVGSYVVLLAQWPVGVVVAGLDNHAILRAGVTGDDVANRKAAFKRCDLEIVAFHLIAF